MQYQRALGHFGYRGVAETVGIRLGRGTAAPLCSLSYIAANATPRRFMERWLNIGLGLLVVCGCAAPEEEASPSTPMLDSTTTVLLAQANEALHAKAYLTGLALTDSALHGAAGAPATHFIRGRLFFALGRMDAARQAYRHVLALDSTYEGAWHNLGNVAFRQRRYREALAHYRREQALHAAPQPWHGMGGTFWTLGQADSAGWAYRRAIEIDPNYAPAYASLADWYESGGAFAEALENAQRALALDPENLGYQYQVGALLARAGRYEEAVVTLRPVADARPWDYSARFTLGQALQRLGRTVEAQSYLEEAAQIRAAQAEVERLGREARNSPESFNRQLAYAEALRQTGRFPEALDAYHLALSLRPQDLALQNNLATLYLQRGDSAEAVARYRDVLRQDSTFVEAWVNLALHYARARQPQAAQAAFEKAVAANPEHPAVRAIRQQMQKR